ncbi:MAG: HEAT repeat domain-containing protein [Anaerolineae bacterium]|nr:HEAT repeat domain-containing protein [Anaerolineae bacterium]
MNKSNSAASMWECLEKQENVPHSKLKYLSGLLDDDITRFTTLWFKLPGAVRRKLITRLGEAAEEDFELDFSAVFSIALADADAATCAAAIEGLAEVEDVRLVPKFVRILQENPAILARAKAAQALAHFVLLGELGKIRPRSFDMARNALLAAYRDGNADLEVRRRALESLSYTALDGIPELIADAYAHSEEKMRISAVFAMGRSADKRWASPVQQELASLLPEMRYEAARACGELGLRQATSDLIEMVEDVDLEVQQAALWALGQIGGRQAQKVLNRYVESDNEPLRDAAREALGELEFFHGDLGSFFGPPAEFDGESDAVWAEERHGSAFDEDDRYEDEDEADFENDEADFEDDEADFEGDEEDLDEAMWFE